MSEKEIKMFVGKKIKKIDVDGFSVFLSLEDGTELFYNATDGGYSSWEIQQKSEGYINCNEIEDLDYSLELLNKRDRQIKELENIMKEVRENIERIKDVAEDIENEIIVNICNDTLEILDKENKQ